MYKDREETRGKAIKLRAGAGDNLGMEIDISTKGAGKLVRIGREKFGGNMVFQVVQPDLFYSGCIIRSMKVSRMAKVMGLTTTPHLSGGGTWLPVHAIPGFGTANAGKYHQFKML